MSALKPRNFLRMLQSGFTTVKGFIATVRREERGGERRGDESIGEEWRGLLSCFLLSNYILDFGVLYFIALCLHCILTF
jgi:hypothetical protein